MVRRAGILLIALLLSIANAAFAAKTHTVKKNQTIASLAKKYHVPVNDLKEANNLLNSRIKPGDVLVIPPRGSKSTATGSAPDTAATYKVRKNDTLSRISKNTGISIADLKRLNGLAKGKLKPGQILALFPVLSLLPAHAL